MYVVRLRTLIFCAVIILISAAVAVFGIRQIGTDPSDAARSFAETDTRRLPVLMYHSLTENPSKVNAYVIPVSEFESDLRWMRDNGYTAVFMNDVISFVEGNGDLPDRPVVITFDDGFENNYEYALPLFEKYDMRGVVSVVGSYTEKYSQIDDKNAEYAYLDFEAISRMKESGRFEFANHSYDMHMLPGMKGNQDGRKGAAKVSGEAEDSYKNKLVADTERLQKLLSEHCGITPNVYTYPYGEISKQSEQILRDMGFKATFSCLEKPNYIYRGNPDCLFCLCRYLRDNKRGAAEILSLDKNN